MQRSLQSGDRLLFHSENRRARHDDRERRKEEFRAFSGIASGIMMGFAFWALLFGAALL